MRTPSLIPEIRHDLAIIAKAVISDESQYVEERWQEIRRQITELAKGALEESEIHRCGWRPTSKGDVIECIDCRATHPAGTRECHCGQPFKKRRPAT